MQTVELFVAILAIVAGVKFAYFGYLASVAGLNVVDTGGLMICTMQCVNNPPSCGEGSVPVLLGTCWTCCTCSLSDLEALRS
ncbi:uncharacterized protein EDB91DRAFT_819749 [Suillus paluster]|uniref:uncharacterized protein n=1 Tax=Suillus paluster TaxID=48578 RepID=UPI001B880713|nr:uncharacterized protein EDB91DRAFT_819749 [Suillus paluster]KAG1748887.1 hypothetical protein EDB91DRAFT_819749 [Suillus paluster]